jgi:predicted nucleic-acid-binding protein
LIALDTNILARYLLDDEPAQARAARRLLAEAKSEYWIPVTVVLELAWVLRKADAPRRLVMERLRDLLSLRNVRAQNADLVFQALRWAAQGMDLADALHLVLSSKAERFATFDEALVKQARKLGVQPPVSAP